MFYEHDQPARCTHDFTAKFASAFSVHDVLSLARLDSLITLIKLWRCQVPVTRSHDSRPTHTQKKHVCTMSCRRAVGSHSSARICGTGRPTSRMAQLSRGWLIGGQRKVAQVCQGYSWRVRLEAELIRIANGLYGVYINKHVSWRLSSNAQKSADQTDFPRLRWLYKIILKTMRKVIWRKGCIFGWEEVANATVQVVLKSP